MHLLRKKIAWISVYLVTILLLTFNTHAVTHQGLLPEAVYIRIDDEVSLRLLTPEDAKQLYNIVHESPHHIGGQIPDALFDYGKIEDGERVIQERNLRWAKFCQQAKQGVWSAQSGRLLQLGIFYKGKLIGIIGLSNAGINPRRVEIYYFLGKQWAHRGITSKACSHIVNYASKALPNLQKIHIRVVNYNLPSIRIIEKAGAKYHYSKTILPRMRLPKVEQACFDALPAVVIKKIPASSQEATPTYHVYSQGRQLATLRVGTPHNGEIPLDLTLVTPVEGKFLVSLYLWAGKWICDDFKDENIYRVVINCMQHADQQALYMLYAQQGFVTVYTYSLDPTAYMHPKPVILPA